MSTVVSIFTQKGGVGKTTTSLNVLHSWFESKKSNNKKAVCVDFDSQVSLTLYNIQYRKFQNVLDNEQKYWDDVLQHSSDISENKRSNFHDCWLGQLRNQIVDSKWTIRDVKLKESKENNKRISMICGSPNTMEIDNSLATEMFSKKAGAYVLNLQKYIVELRSKYDFIVLDLNPTLSATNVILLHSSDKIVCPVIPEKFSIIGVKLLKRMFYDKLLTEFKFLGESKSHQDQLCGFLVNRLKPYNTGGLQYTDSHNAFLARLEETIYNEFGEDNLIIGKILQWDSLAAMLQERSITVYEATNDILNTSTWNEKVVNTKNQIDNVLTQILGTDEDEEIEDNDDNNDAD